MSEPSTYTRVTEYKVSVFPDHMANSGDMLTASEADTWSLNGKTALDILAKHQARATQKG